MVWPFKKRKEVVDWTILVKRGLIKPAQEKDLDLSQQTPVSSDSLGFLSSMASSAESSSSGGMGGASSNKIDDIEYKLDALSRRLGSMIDRIDLMEKKVDRLERHEI